MKMCGVNFGVCNIEEWLLCNVYMVCCIEG